MQIETVRFGKVDIDEKKVLVFREGLPGLEQHKDFAILQFEPGNPILWLQSTKDPSICLPVVDSFAVCPDYAFNISDDDAQALDLKSPEDLHVMSVLVIPESIEQMTMNLAAPIIVNMRCGSAKQIILGGGDYNVRFPVFAQICAFLKEDDADAGAVTKD